MFSVIRLKAIYYERCEQGWHVPESVALNHIVILVIDGAFRYTVNGRELAMSKDDMLYVPQGAVRSAQGGEAEGHRMYVAHFYYDGDGERLALLTDGQHRRARTYHAEYLKQRFALTIQQWLRKPAYYETLCHAMLLEPLALLNAEAELPPSIPPHALGLARQIEEFIVSRYLEPLDVPTIAAHVNRTPNYVSNVFRAATGQTITDYIQQIRIAAARDLLLNTQMTIGEISDYLGFCEQSYFTKVFKRVTGSPPSAFVKEPASHTRFFRD